MPTRTKKPQPAGPAKTKPRETSAPSTSAAPSRWVVAALLAVSIGALYCCGPVLRVPFIFDDLATIKTNQSIRSLWPLVGPPERPGPLNPPVDLPTSGRPLVNLSFAMNYFFGGLSPVGYHVVNVLIHLLTSLLVWSVVRRTLLLPYFAGRFVNSAGWLATAVALLWALHPLQTETVVYVTQRTELMVAFFYLATIYCSLRYWSVLALPLGEGRGEGDLKISRNGKPRSLWLVLAVFACASGMASKEVMASAPLIVLLYERTFIAGSLKAALRRSWPLYAGLASTWLVLLYVSLGAPHGESAGFGLGVGALEWWFTQSQILLMYLKLAIWPSPLLIHYQLPYLTTLAEAWMYVAPVLLLAAIVAYLLWRNHPVGFLGSWMFAILLPTLLIPIILEMAAERRMYLPLLPLVITGIVAVYLFAQRLLQRSGQSNAVRPALIALMLLLACTFGLVAAKRLAAYNNEITLWQEVLEHQTGNHMAHNNLGRLLIDAGQLPEAIAELRKSIAIKPDHYSAYNNLGVALDHSGRYPEAIETLNHALKLKPDYTDALQNLGNSLRNMGRLPEAIEKLEHALRLQPDDAVAQNNMGVLMASTGKTAKAIERFRQAAKFDPTYVAAYINLGKVLSMSGDADGAAEALKQAVRLQPNRADLQNELGVTLGTSGQHGEAIEHFQIALRLDPNFAQAYSNLALSLAFVNRPEEAIITAQRGIEVARSTGQADVAMAAEKWLTHYRAELQTGRGSVAPGPPPSQQKKN